MISIANTDVSIESHSKLHAVYLEYLGLHAASWTPFTFGACKTCSSSNQIDAPGNAMANYSSLHVLSSGHLVPDLPHQEPYEAKSICMQRAGRHLPSGLAKRVAQAIRSMRLVTLWQITRHCTSHLVDISYQTCRIRNHVKPNRFACSELDAIYLGALQNA